MVVEKETVLGGDLLNVNDDLPLYIEPTVIKVLMQLDFVYFRGNTTRIN